MTSIISVGGGGSVGGGASVGGGGCVSTGGLVGGGFVGTIGAFVEVGWDVRTRPGVDVVVE